MAEDYAVFEKAPLTDIRRYETTSQTLTLTPKVGHKFILDEVLADGPSYADIKVGNTLVMRVPIAKNDCVFTPKPGGYSPSAGFLNWLRKYVMGAFIKATPDKPLSIEFDAAPTKATIYYYDLPDNVSVGAEITGVEDTLPYVGIITHSAAVSASGTVDFDTPVMPTGSLALKDGARVPANVVLNVYALAFASVANGGSKFTHLHVWAQDVELLTPEDHVGVSVDPDYNELKFDVTKLQAFVLKTPYPYKPGYLLTLKGDAVYDGTNTLGAETNYAYIIGLLKIGKA